MNAPVVIIVGAGPAGLSAAVTAAAAGMQVTVIDERGVPGGRLRFDLPGATSLDAYLSECQRLGVVIRSRTVAWGLFPGWQIPLETPEGAELLETEHLILATGSLDRGLAFDGNTLPGVMSGTGLRRIIGHLGVLPGQRVLILGDGPDGAATAHAVRSAGGQVLALIPEEQARAISVRGNGAVESWVVDGREQEVDIVAVAVGRQPDLQLATMGGHELTWMPHKGGWSPYQHGKGDDRTLGLLVAGDAAGVDTIRICELDGALAAARLAASLGLAPQDAADAIAAEIAELRPDRLTSTGDERRHRQPWSLPIEVSQ